MRISDWSSDVCSSDLRMQDGPVMTTSGEPDHRWFPPGTHITVRGLSKQFNGTVIYENFDLDLPRGKVVSVFGPTGCGKSTIIHMIAGLIPLDRGYVPFAGKTIDETRIGYAL